MNGIIVRKPLKKMALWGAKSGEYCWRGRTSLPFLNTVAWYRVSRRWWRNTIIFFISVNAYGDMDLTSKNTMRSCHILSQFRYCWAWLFFNQHVLLILIKMNRSIRTRRVCEFLLPLFEMGKHFCAILWVMKSSPYKTQLSRASSFDFLVVLIKSEEKEISKLLIIVYLAFNLE